MDGAYRKVDQVVWPARTIQSSAALHVFVEDVAGASTLVGETPGRLELGEHRQWHVIVRSGAFDATWEELARLEVPGVRISARSKDAPALTARAAELPRLRRLTLTGGAGDGALAQLGARPLLADLHVDALKATASGLSALRTPNLVRLSLTSCSKPSTACVPRACVACGSLPPGATPPRSCRALTCLAWT